MNTTPVAPIQFEIGQPVWLAGDPHPWAVKAVSENFAVLTIQMASRTNSVDVLYTVLDWRNGVRGPCNLVGQAWGDGTYTEAECTEMLAQFEVGDLEVSHRNNVRIEFGEVAW